ncbi:hypothetical protein MPSEU_000411000 [Mayamaea pseudoterrestris]|nr:hypothetical protein MPSEU_000411000 [Mayamaea pseudoterrestris]
MFGSSQDQHRFVDSSGEITFSDLSPTEIQNQNPSVNNINQLLTSAPSYSEGSDSGSSPANKHYCRPSGFVSQDSIIIEDDEDYEVMSDNEMEETTHHGATSPSSAHLAPSKSPRHCNANDADVEDEMSFEGDADDEGGGETDDERATRKGLKKLLPQTPKSKEFTSSLGAAKVSLLNPLTPRRSHKDQMNELSSLFERDSKPKKEHGRHKRIDSGSMTSPLPTSLLKYIRKWSKEKSEGGADAAGTIARSATGVGDNEDEEAGSDEFANDTDDDEFSLDDYSSDWEYPASNEIAWETMPTLPLQFHNWGANGNRQRTPHYLDACMLTEDIAVDDADRFAWEHGMLLQAVLQLLAERDQVGVEGSIDSGENIWKKGPLKRLSSRAGKKLSAQWKVKYVELRHGNLCYYEDSGHGRKMIHLRQSDAEVKPSLCNKNNSGYVFELSVLGASTSYWMANSEEERQAWIKSIQSAMLGSIAPKRDVDLAPHHKALAVYNAIQTDIQTATTKEQYLDATKLVFHQEEAVRVPVEWVMQKLVEQPRAIDNQLMHKRAKTNASAQKQMKSSILEFWKNLEAITFCLNGIKIPRASTLASERLFGALTKALLEFDKVVAEEELSAPELTELQAISYARNILLAVIHHRDENSTLLAVHDLFDNPNLVCISAIDETDQIVNLEVSVAGEELPDELPHFDDELSSWLWVRRLKQAPKSHKKRFAVMSEGVLSFYEAALPRPSGLRGQTVLSGAKLEIGVDETGEAEERYSLTIRTRKDKEDLVLSFDNETDFAEWRECIQEHVDQMALAYDSSSAALHLDDSLDTSLVLTAGIELDAAISEGEDESEGVEMSSELVLKQFEALGHRKPTLLGSSASRLSRAAGKTAGKIADTAGKVAETAGKMAGTAGKAAGKVAGTAGKLTDEGIRIAKSTAAGSLRGGIRVAKGAISKTPGVNVVRGAVGRTVGRLRSTSKGTAAELMDYEGGAKLKRRPSMQMLLSNTALADKREPTVQCVVQASQTFHVLARDNGEVLCTVHAKLYQAFLVRGGPSGRMAQGDALIQMEVIETPLEGDVDDDSEEDISGICALPEGLWRP